MNRGSVLWYSFRVRSGLERRETHEVPVENISLHVAVDHPLVAVNQSLKGTLGSSIGRILGPSSIDL
jgi:hypothetical protein